MRLLGQKKIKQFSYRKIKRFIHRQITQIYHSVIGGPQTDLELQYIRIPSSDFSVESLEKTVQIQIQVWED
jgi:hypothetical protein